MGVDPTVGALIAVARGPGYSIEELLTGRAFGSSTLLALEEAGEEGRQT